MQRLCILGRYGAIEIVLLLLLLYRACRYSTGGMKHSGFLAAHNLRIFHTKVRQLSEVFKGMGSKSRSHQGRIFEVVTAVARGIHINAWTWKYHLFVFLH